MIQLSNFFNVGGFFCGLEIKSSNSENALKIAE